MGLISVIWGIFAMLFMCLALIPLLGWLNWLVIPFAGIGAILGGIAMSATAREKNGRAKTGLILNAIVIVVAAIRLSMGGGIL